MSHTAELIAVGTELLLGNIANTDAQMISQGLSELGINVFYHTVVGDNPERVRQAVDIAEEMGVSYKVGNLLSSDIFYNANPDASARWTEMGVLGVEMESAALYCNAARAGKKALCICTVSDSFIYPEENTTAEERQTSFTKMMEIALELA